MRHASRLARPVVAARVGGMPEAVEHGKTGWLVDLGDTEGLAGAIVQLLEHPELATQMGQAARRRAKEVFSLERCANAYEALYRKLVTGVPRAASFSLAV